MVKVRSKHPKKAKHVWGGELEEERVGSYFIWQNLLASCSWTRQLDWACSDLAAGNWTGWTRKKWHSAAGNYLAARNWTEWTMGVIWKQDSWHLNYIRLLKEWVGGGESLESFLHGILRHSRALGSRHSCWTGSGLAAGISLEVDHFETGVLSSTSTTQLTYTVLL